MLRFHTPAFHSGRLCYRGLRHYGSHRTAHGSVRRCHILSSILLLVSGIALSIPKRLPKCNAAVSRMPSLWKPVHLRICVPCVILCRHVFSCFCLPLFFTRKRNSLTHYLHSSHLDLSLRRFSLRVGSFFFVPLL